MFQVRVCERCFEKLDAATSSQPKALDLTTLVERRKRGDLIQMYKIVHNIDKVDKSNHFNYDSNIYWFVFMA